MAEATTIGLYSFPKSGNTWVRHILASLLGIDKANLGKYIPDSHRQGIVEDPIDFKGRTYYIYKSHYNKELRRKAGIKFRNDLIIHIRRNPLDVFLSYLNYISGNVTNSAPAKFKSVEDILGTQLFEAYFHAWALSGILQPNFQPAGNWFQANKFWLDQTETKDKPAVVSIRYEDLFDQPVETLSFLKDWFDVTDKDITQALTNADAQTSQDGKFFWRRKANSFADMLSDEQIDFFLKCRGAEVEALGYPASAFYPEVEKTA